MPSVIEVKEKTVNNREVVSFSKQYREQLPAERMAYINPSITRLGRADAV